MTHAHPSVDEKIKQTLNKEEESKKRAAEEQARLETEAKEKAKTATIHSDLRRQDTFGLRPPV